MSDTPFDPGKAFFEGMGATDGFLIWRGADGLICHAATGDPVWLHGILYIYHRRLMLDCLKAAGVQTEVRVKTAEEVAQEELALAAPAPSLEDLIFEKLVSVNPEITRDRLKEIMDQVTAAAVVKPKSS